MHEACHATSNACFMHPKRLVMHAWYATSKGCMLACHHHRHRDRLSCHDHGCLHMATMPLCCVVRASWVCAQSSRTILVLVCPQSFPSRLCPQSFQVPFTFCLCGCVLVVYARQMVHVDGACWMLDVAYAMLRDAPHLLFLCPPEASCSCAPPPDLLFL